MARDNYKGIPKKYPMMMDKDGTVQLPHPHAATVGDGAYSPMVVASGVLVAGYTSATHSSIGWHSMVMTTAQSGTKTTPVAYTIDVANKVIHFNGEDNADVRRFTYVLHNPGHSSPKV